MNAATTDRVGSVLREAVARLGAAGIATARQDAELLLARVLGTTRLALHLGPQEKLSTSTLPRFEALVARRAGHEPLQYILGEAEFCGLRIAVGPGVFIPRPETELLVERALATAPTGTGLAVDVGAGSGAVACALAARHAGLSVWAVERSLAALAWARQNVRQLGLAARVTLLEGDLFAPLAQLGSTGGLAGRCDLVLANPPYIARPDLLELPDEVRLWEPLAALDGGSDGTEVTRRILDDAPDFLRRDGVLLVEIGRDQAALIGARLATDVRYARFDVHRDFIGRERVLEATRA